MLQIALLLLLAGCASVPPHPAKSRVPVSYYTSVRCVERGKASSELPRPDLDEPVNAYLDRTLKPWAGERVSPSALPEDAGTYRPERKTNPDRRTPYRDFPPGYCPATEAGARLFIWIRAEVYEAELKRTMEITKAATEATFSVLMGSRASFGSSIGNSELNWALVMPGGDLVEAGYEKFGDIEDSAIQRDAVDLAVKKMKAAAQYKPPKRTRPE